MRVNCPFFPLNYLVNFKLVLNNNNMYWIFSVPGSVRLPESPKTLTRQIERIASQFSKEVIGKFIKLKTDYK